MNLNLTLVTQTIAMIVFVWFCMKFIWPTIIQALEARRKNIADGIAAAQKAGEELEQAKTDAEQLVSQARQQAGEIVDQANRRAGRYIGAVRLQFEFAEQSGPYCGWLHVDPQTLAQEAASLGWGCETILEEESGDYLARLTPLAAP